MPLLTQIICVNLLLLNMFSTLVVIVVARQPEVASAPPMASTGSPSSTSGRKWQMSEQSTTNDDHRSESISQDSQINTTLVSYEFTQRATPTQPTNATPPPTDETQPTNQKHLMNNDHDHHPYDAQNAHMGAHNAAPRPPPNYQPTFKMPRPALRHRNLNPIQNDVITTAATATATAAAAAAVDDDDYAGGDDDDGNGSTNGANDAQLDNPLSRFYITNYLFMEFRSKNWSDRPLGELSPGGAGADPMHPVLPAAPTHMVPGGTHAPAPGQQPFLLGVPAVVAPNGSSLLPMTISASPVNNGELMANFTVNILPRPYFGDSFTAFQQSFQSVQVILSLIFCVIGIFANLTNVVVLTRPNMITAVNTILCAIACSDFIVNISNIPYLLHALFDQNTFGYFSYEWAVYTLMHAHVTVTAHTISIWLTCVLATWRYFVVCSKSANQRNWSVSLALRVIIIVVILVPIFCIPCYLSFMITSELRHQGDIMYSVGFTALAESSQFFRTFHFWMFSGLTKLLPCVLLTFFTTVLVRKLLSARERRLRLTSGNQSSGANHAPSPGAPGGGGGGGASHQSRASFAGARTMTATTTAATNAGVSQASNHDRKCIPNGRPPSELMRSLTSGNQEEDDERRTDNESEQQSTVRLVANGQTPPPPTSREISQSDEQQHQQQQQQQQQQQEGTSKRLQLLARKESTRSHQRVGLAPPEQDSNCFGTDQQQQQQQPAAKQKQRRIVMLSSSSSTTTTAAAAAAAAANARQRCAQIPMGPNSNSSCATDAECLAVSCNGSSIDENSIDMQQGGGHLLVETTDSGSTRTCSASPAASQTNQRLVSASLSTNSVSSMNAALTSPPASLTSTAPHLLAKPSGGGAGGGQSDPLRKNSRSASTRGALELYATINNDNQPITTTSSRLEPAAASTLQVAPSPLTRTSLAISAQDFTIQLGGGADLSPNRRPIRGVASSLSQSNMRFGRLSGDNASHKHTAAGGSANGTNSTGRNSIDPHIASPSATAPNSRVRSVGSASFTPFNLVKLQATHRQLSQNETTTRLLIAVMVLFLVCEFPAGLLAALCAILGQEFFDNVYQPMGGLTDLFALINSSINFVLYCFMSTQFRVTFYQVVLRCPAPKSPRTN